MAEYGENLMKKRIGVGDYYAVLRFFTELISLDYEYVILMSRRCQVLFHMFEQYFAEDVKDKLANKTIITDSAVVCHIDAMQGKSVVIIDDIVIHGRGIKKIYDLIKEYCKPKKLYVHVYFENKNMDCLPDDIKGFVQNKFMVGENEWRKFSNRIVDTILATNTPYTSYLMVYKYKGNYKNLEEYFTSQHTFKKEITESRYQNDILTTFYLDSKLKEKPLFKTLSYMECLRIYHQNNDETTIIPYIFIKEIPVENSIVFFDEFAKALPQECSFIKDCLKVTSKNLKIYDLLLCYKLRLMTNVLSVLYWKTLIEESKYHQDIFQCDIRIIKDVFNMNIVNELQMLFQLDTTKLMEFSYDLRNFSDEGIDSDDAITFGRMCSMSKDCKEIIQDHFLVSWLSDEKLAKDGKDRNQGVSIHDIFKYVQINKLDKKEMLANLVHAWDIGIAAGTFGVSSHRKYVTSYNPSGEQSYRLPVEKYKYILSSLIAVSNFIRLPKDEKVDEKEEYTKFIQYRVEKLIELLNCFDNCFKIAHYDEIKSMILLSDGYLEGWNIEELLRFNDDDISAINICKEIVNVFLEENMRYWR